MSVSLFVAALGLLFVFEGILPFLSPRFWRQVIVQMMMRQDRAIRVMGLVSMVVGAILVGVARHF